MHLTEYHLRISELKAFSKLYNEYESTNNAELRNSVSSMSRKISAYIEDAGVGTYLNDANNGSYHIFENIVNGNLASKELVDDRVYSAVGVYEYRYAQLKRKLINPLFWAGEIIRIPFHIMKFAGFNAEKIELSTISKIYKFIAGLIFVIAAVFQILSLSGVDTKFVGQSEAIEILQPHLQQ